MFDIGWSELVVIAVVALIVVGPKDLPRLLRSLGQIMRKIRRMTQEFKSGIDDMIRESEIDEVRKSIHHVSNFDPQRHLDTYMKPSSADPTGGKPPPATTTPPPDLTPDPVEEKPAKDKTGEARD